MNDYVNVVIIGAGLSGLHAAYQLEKAGISYRILEARPITGGRIISCGSDDTALLKETRRSGRIDLGATWVWPSFQPLLASLITDLGIKLIAQSEDGDMLYERTHNQSPSRHPGYASSPPSMRLAGGMRLLTERLEERLQNGHILTDRCVSRIEKSNDVINIHANSAKGTSYEYKASVVLLALPPALASGIEYVPALPAELSEEWAHTGTWMAPHAKYVAVYESNFWRNTGLSGEARSGVGPMAEIHDASEPGEVNALFGFLGIPARARWTTSEENLKTLCRAQLMRLFGEKASTPVAEYFKDWADDPYTATAKDLLIQAGHTVPPATPARGEWMDSLNGIGSEWSTQFPGYVAGAIDASMIGVKRARQFLMQKK